MKTGLENIVPIPTREKSKREATLGRDIDSLVDVFRELHEIEAMTGRAGLSARVLCCVTDILASADRLALETLTHGKNSGKARP